LALGSHIRPQLSLRSQILHFQLGNPHLHLGLYAILFQQLLLCGTPLILSHLLVTLRNHRYTQRQDRGKRCNDGADRINPIEIHLPMWTMY